MFVRFVRNGGYVMLRVQRDGPLVPTHIGQVLRYRGGILCILAHNPEDGILVVLLQRDDAKSDI